MLHQSTSEDTSSISAQSSSEIDKGQGDMVDETIKDVTHKLHQTSLTSDMGTTNSVRTPSACSTKTINTPNVDDIRTQTIPDTPLKDSTTDFQLSRNVSLIPSKYRLKYKSNTYQGNPTSQRKYHTHTNNV